MTNWGVLLAASRLLTLNWSATSVVITTPLLGRTPSIHSCTSGFSSKSIQPLLNPASSGELPFDSSDAVASGAGKPGS